MSADQVATYRVQLHPGLGFDEAAGLVTYLRDLGVSHLYTSPYLQAARGSTHGYDVVDPGRVNSELGGSEAHERMCGAFTGAGLGHMIDLVPNHMAIAGRQNPWWWDVLENGPSSRYATWFDVDWESSEERWPNKVLLPVLGDHYGRILEDGQIILSHDGGSFILYYHEHSFPLDPSSLAGILQNAAESCGSERLSFIASSHARLPRPTVTARESVEKRHRDKAVLARILTALCREDPAVSEAIDAEVARINSDPDELDMLLDQQNYRLAFWRAGSRDLGYRRFFDMKHLVGVRVEEMEVFRSIHELPFEWMRLGWVDGLRIDHPDGLRDPTEYFTRLRSACPGAWVVAEKILMPGEELPRDWPVAGTTGYDFLNLSGGLFVDPEGERGLSGIWEEFSGDGRSFEEVVTESKRHVLTELLGSELNRLASLFVSVCERHRRHRDYTRHELREALLETAVWFPVYRTYARAPEGKVPDVDAGYIAESANRAASKRDDLDPELFRFLEDLLMLRFEGSLEGEMAVRFQQLTGPAMAKGMEDTAFYRYNRLVSLNEVGGWPGIFGRSPEDFHSACAEARKSRPLSLLASTTHDTKRSGDVRARLALLSEIPGRWSAAVRRWSGMCERYRSGDSPERGTEYLFYQTLVGAWPIGTDRMKPYMEKAAREAKTRTSWNNVNEEYERDLMRFVESAMGDAELMADVGDLAASLVEPGRINSLALTLLKLTAPGVPDIYQGTELWDLSLVDPDNRRPVDFEMRRSALDRIGGMSVGEIIAAMDEGLPKMWLIRKALSLRRERLEPFGREGSYRSLRPHGPKERHIVAFARGEEVVTVVPRLVAGLAGLPRDAESVLPLDRCWEGTSLELPGGRWADVLTGEEHSGGETRAEDILARFPVSLLSRKG